MATVIIIIIRNMNMVVKVTMIFTMTGMEFKTIVSCSTDNFCTKDLRKNSCNTQVILLITIKVFYHLLLLHHILLLITIDIVYPT